MDKVMILQHYLRNKYKRVPKDRDAFEQWQEKKILQQMDYVRKHSAFYRELWKDLPNEKWQEFPIIDKSIMMENFDALNTFGITKEEAFAIAERAEQSRDFSPMIGSTTVGLSSGTSGNRGIFLVSKQERRAWTGTILAKALPQSIFKKEKIAFFLRANSNLYSSVNSNQIEFSFYDLLDPVQKHIERLHQQSPGILVAPASMLRMLAEEMEKGSLQISPHKVISVAEVLDPIDRQMIERAFQQTVHQIYQCTEGFLAHTCTYGTLHLNEDVVAIQKEYLNEQEGKFMPIITDFSRKAQPIIRYRLNDVLTEKKNPCPCGSPMLAIEGIDGREDDVFYFKRVDHKELLPIFSDFISRSIITASSHIKEYMVIQYDIDKVEIGYLVDEGISDSQHMQIEQNITERIRLLCEKTETLVPTIDFYKMDQGIESVYPSEIKAIDVKKLRRIERRFDIHDTD